MTGNSQDTGGDGLVGVVHWFLVVVVDKVDKVDDGRIGDCGCRPLGALAVDD